MAEDPRSYWMLGRSKGGTDPDALGPIVGKWGIFLFDREEDALRYRTKKGYAAVPINLTVKEMWQKLRSDSASLELEPEEVLFELNPHLEDARVLVLSVNEL